MNQPNRWVTNERPLGITVLAALVALFGLFGLCRSLFEIAGSLLQVLTLHPVAGVSALVGGVVGLVLAILQIGVAGGLWSLRPWAFWVTIGVEVLAVLHAVLVYGFGALWVALIPILILVYMFLDGNVRRSFHV